MLRWFVFTVGAGLLPFAFSCFMRALHGHQGDGAFNSPELLFFSLMVLFRISLWFAAIAGVVATVVEWHRTRRRL